jgi:two-component system nitrogen regulation sensor histidine kinase NtrY
MFRVTPTVEAPPAPEPRRRFLDNPRVLTLAVLLLIGVLGGLFWLSRRSVEFEPQVVTEVLLYPLLAVCVALLLALGFVLARNLVKLWVEQRRAEPFARFRAKLVGALLAMTIVPAVLVLISGSSILSDSAARWFSAPVDQVLTDAKNLARRFYQEQQESMAWHAHRLARVLPPQAVAGADEAAVTRALTDEVSTLHDARIELYRRVPAVAPATGVALVTAVESPTLPPGKVRASADRLAQQAISSGDEQLGEEMVASGGTLLRAAAPILSADGIAVGAVVVSRLMPAEIDRDARRIAHEWEAYRGLELNRTPILFSYLTILLTAALLILIAATWLGLYLAKRITRPVQQLAEGARAIGAGHLDVRLTPETSDEMGSLVEAFNMMAAELETNRGKLEGRRRYIETILERVATGVISLDASGRIQTINGAAERLLGIGRGQIGQPLNDVLARPDLEVLRPMAGAVETGTDRGLVQEISLTREGREINLATAATVLTRADGVREGAVLVLDDVTPLIRAQRVAAWRDVARRLAHEIKNPLTPIQLSAERMRRHFAGGAPQAQALVTECTDAIITEVEALKGLVDEFAQFARMRGPRMVPADLNQLIGDTLKLYEGVLQQGHVRLERQLAVSLPPVRMDGEQIRQVIINLVDNALEALGGATAPLRPSGDRPLIIVMTIHDVRNSLVRLLVSDNGPGVPASERDKLFMPYYSTKGRGSGLGLAIVRRILVEHGGGIEVSEAQPTGTTFTVELPVA